MNSGRIEVTGLTKTFGPVRAVNSLTFTAEPGRVTGFLGPNGSGKTTTLMMLLGLITPDSGTSTIGGAAYHELERPALTVGSALEANFHPAHTARAHLDIYRRAIGVPADRVTEMLEFVGLSHAMDRRTGGFSLGMRQRLALAVALLGNPQVVVLDEPINGIDPEGIRWIRVLLRHLAAEGKTVLLSSHMLGEVQQTVDDLVIIHEGALAYAGPLQDLHGMHGGGVTVLVSAVGGPEGVETLRAALDAAGLAPEPPARHTDNTVLRVHGTSADAVGQAAFAAGIALRHLSEERANLEQSFLDLVDPAQAQTQGVRNAATTA